jgi:hypothetical protein
MQLFTTIFHQKKGDKIKMEAEFSAKCREFGVEAPEYILNQLKPGSLSQSSSSNKKLCLGGQPINLKVGIYAAHIPGVHFPPIAAIGIVKLRIVLTNSRFH